MVLIEAPSTAGGEPPTGSDGDQAPAAKAPSQTPSAPSSDHHGDPKAAQRTSDTPRSEPTGKAQDSPIPAKADERPARKFKFREDFDNATDDSAATSRKPRATTPAPPRHPDAARQVTESTAGTPAPEPTVGFVKSTVRRYQQWLLIGAAAVVGLALALLVVGILSARRGRPDDDPVAKTATPANAPTEDAKAATTSAGKEVPKDGEQGAVDNVPPPDDSAAAPDNTVSDTADDSATSNESASAPDVEAPAGSTDLGESGTDTTPEMATKGKEPAETDLSPAKPPADADAGAIETDSQVATVKSQLLFPFVAIEFKADDEVTLADFCEFISSTIDVPITLDVDALDAARVSPAEIVECNLRGTTAEQALESVVEQLGVGFSVRAGTIVIAPPGADQFSDVTYDVSDLAADPTQAATLAEQIKSLVDKYSWENMGGDGSIVANERKLTIQQSSVTHYRITRLLDRLRAARGLLPRSDLPRSILQVAPAFIQAAGNLGLSVSATFPQPTSLERVLRHLQAESDMLVLADWPALSDLGIPATYAVSPSLPSQPFYKLLDSLLAPLKLDYRVTDAGTIQISSQEALRNHLEVELYKIVDDPTLDMGKLTAEIKTYVGEPFFSSPDAPGEIVFDAPSRCLLVSLPQPQQRAVAAWLNINRKVASTASAR
jgi:hypothetical protein